MLLFLNVVRSLLAEIRVLYPNRTSAVTHNVTALVRFGFFVILPAHIW